MPTISIFYGIYIFMHPLEKEHNPPHIHAIYGDNEARFLIGTGEIVSGRFPNKGSKLVKEFIEKYRKELLEMWETQVFKKLEPLQ